MFRRNGPVDMKANPPSNSNDDEAVVSGARRNRKGSRLLGGAVICALIGIVLLWYKLVIPHPMPYISPSFDRRGTRFRMELPVGWEVMDFKPMTPRGTWGRAELMIGERDMDWRPKWLAKLWPRNNQPRPFLLVQIFRLPEGRLPRNLRAPASGGSLAWKEESPPQPGEKWIAPNGTLAHLVYVMGRSYFTPDGAFQIYVQYHSEDRPQLLPTLNAMGKTSRLTR